MKVVHTHLQVQVQVQVTSYESHVCSHLQVRGAIGPHPPDQEQQLALVDNVLHGEVERLRGSDVEGGGEGEVQQEEEGLSVEAPLGEALPLVLQQDLERLRREDGVVLRVARL